MKMRQEIRKREVKKQLGRPKLR